MYNKGSSKLTTIGFIMTTFNKLPPNYQPLNMNECEFPFVVFDETIIELQRVFDFFASKGYQFSFYNHSSVYYRYNAVTNAKEFLELTNLAFFDSYHHLANMPDMVLDVSLQITKDNHTFLEIPYQCAYYLIGEVITPVLHDTPQTIQQILGKNYDTDTHTFLNAFLNANGHVDITPVKPFQDDFPF